MGIGIRMHDLPEGTFEQRVRYAKEQGFSCLHIALSKVISPELIEPWTVTPGLAGYIRRALDGMDAAVLGCYLNLAHPDEGVYKKTLERYIGQLKLCRWLGAGVVGTETGNPNAEYVYDPERSHSEEALELFIERLRPVVESAEKLGTTLAIEPVFTHIVYDAKRARRVLDEIASPNLQIILDPVNLLHPSNVERCDSVIREAIELLGDDTVVIHMKDYAMKDGKLLSLAVGTGIMDYRAIAEFAVKRKPHIQMTLEDTNPGNAVAARLYLQRQLDAIG